jgi:hypothetical protein
MSRPVTRIVCGVALTTTLVLAVHQPRRPARRLRFDDPSDPARGGVIDMLLGGDEDGGTGEAYHMLDNMTINRYGQLVLQEDTGNNRYLARIWLYDIASERWRSAWFVRHTTQPQSSRTRYLGSSRRISI